MGLDLEKAIATFLHRDDMVVVVDCVHGASRLHVRELFDGTSQPSLLVLRDTADVTFGGVALSLLRPICEGWLISSRKRCSVETRGDN